MSGDEEDTRLLLEKVLRKFSVEQMREHAVRELEPGSWNRALQAIQMANVTHTPQHYSTALTSVQRRPPHRECIENLKLKAAGLSTSKNWQVFQLGQRTISRDLSPPEAARAIGTALDMPIRVTQGAHGCLLFGIGKRMSVAAFYSETSTLMIAFKMHQYIQFIATALGYDQVKDCHLSGHHMLSLLRMIQAKNGGSSLLNTINNHTDKENIKQLPTRTKYGLDFSQCLQNAKKVEQKLGLDPPKLQSLAVVTEVPVKDRDMPICTRVALSSSDVIASLKDMAESGLVEEDNFYFVMLEKGRSELTVKYHGDE